MILAIDIGNTNIVLGIIDNDKIIFTGRLSTDKLKTADEYALLFSGLINMHSINIKNIEGVIVSSVVPPLTLTMKRAIKRLTDKEPFILGPGLKTGLNIKLDNPAQLGCDQVADAVAAINKYPAPLMVLDMGTATTVSVIDKNKSYLGGLIIPGIRISQEALSSSTSQLPRISLEKPEKVIGSNTIDCMKSGAVYGTAAMIDGLADRIETELGEKVTIVATGGNSECIVPVCKRNIIYDSNLLLDGLNIIYKKNKR
ncbi:MAG: type III pantothenate kinase [Oscillospiraceae bacterium]|nr:type III pantothenate kinase [Oscillospiraceae bacterium]